MTKKNKLWLIAVYCIVGVLLISVIACSIANMSYRPQIEDPLIINIQDGSYGKYITGSKENNQEVYDEILEKFNKSFNESVLSSVFSGRSGFESIVSEYGKTNPNTNFTGFRVTLEYNVNDPKTIMLDGKPYNPPTNTSKIIKYTKIIFDVNETAGMTRHYIYYVSYDEATSKNIYYQQSVMCDFSDLYALLLTY